jgi:hypothetical protein
MMVINPAVAKVLRENNEIRIAFGVLFGGYDPDIDPLFNPDWRAKQAIREQDFLDFVMAKLNAIDKDVEVY